MSVTSFTIYKDSVGDAVAPEPWRTGGIFYRPDGDYQNVWGPTPAGFASGDRIAENVALANARRIVACVNACEGISTEALEATKDIAMGGLATVKSIEEQRDELAAILRDLIQSIDWLNQPQPFESGQAGHNQIMTAYNNALARARTVLAKLK